MTLGTMEGDMHSGFKTFEDQSGVDPRCYFATVARSLIQQFGTAAVQVVEQASLKMKLAGDRDGFELWEAVALEVQSLIEEPSPVYAPVVTHRPTPVALH